MGAVAVIVAFLIWVLRRMVLGGESLYWGDLFIYFQPLQRVVSDALATGRLPLWNPHILAGQPLVGNPQSWVFYPSTPLLALLGSWRYLVWNSFGHLCVGGIGTYLYCRHLRADRAGSALAGIVYSGSGFMMARLQFPTMIQAAAYLPLILLLTDRLIDRPRVWYAAMLAGVVGLSVLAAHTQVTYLSLVLAALYGGTRLWWVRRHGIRASQAVKWFLPTLPVGVLTASVQLLPAMELVRLSTRNDISYLMANRFTLHPTQLLSLILPRFFGHPADGNYWAPGNLWEPCVYLGIVPLALAAFAGAALWRRRVVRFYAVLAVVALWLAMGRYGGLFWFAYTLVPGVRVFHDPARFSMLATIAVAVMAAMGMRALRDRGLRAGWRVVIVIVAALDLGAFTTTLNPTIDPNAFGYRPRVLAIAPKPGRGRTFTALTDQVWRRYINYTDYGPDSARYAHELSDTMASNLGMWFGVEEASGYEPVPVKRVVQVDGLVRTALARQSPHLPDLLRLYNAHVLLLPQARRISHPAFLYQRARGVSAWVLREPGPRAWLVGSVRLVRDEARSLAALADPAFDPLREAIVADTTPSTRRPSSAYVAQREPVGMAGPLTADVSAGPDGGFLVWSATWYPGWSALIDGKRYPVVRTDHAFTGVEAPPGRHRIQLVYEPAAVRIGLYLSLLGAGVIGCGLGFGAVVRPVRRRFARFSPARR